MSAVGSPFAFWNDPIANTLDPEVVSPLMDAETGNQPFVPLVSEPEREPRRAVPSRDVVGLRDLGDVARVGADVDVRAVRGEAADERR